MNVNRKPNDEIVEETDSDEQTYCKEDKNQGTAEGRVEVESKYKKYKVGNAAEKAVEDNPGGEGRYFTPLVARLAKWKWQFV